MQHVVAVADREVLIPLPLGTGETGKSLGDLAIKASNGTSYVAAPTSTFSLTLTEVDSVNLPGVHVLRVIPTTSGSIYLSVVHTAGSYTQEFHIQVGHQDLDLLGTEAQAAAGDLVVTVQAPADTAIEGALVRVYDTAGTSLVTTGTTAADGTVTFGLPAGTYKTRVSKANYDFSSINPTTVVVVANDSVTPIISTFLPTSAAGSATIAIFGRYFHATSSAVLFDAAATATSNVSADGTALLIAVPAGSAGTLAVQVRKPDPANPGSYLTSNTLTFTRT